MLRNILHTARINILPKLLGTENVALQQTRNTFILKRRWEPRLHNKGAHPKRLKNREFTYDLVEDQTTIRKPDLSVVLTTYVNGVGDKGDVVALRPNFAYDSLILPGLAVYDSPENREKYKSDGQVKKTHSSRDAERTVNVFERRLISVCMNKDVPWVLKPWHIRASMRKAGMYVLNDSAIELPSKEICGPDPDKQNKEFFVTVTINNLEKARVRCRIHHWSIDPKTRYPFAFQHWNMPAEPLFPEENNTKDTTTTEPSTS